jgi:Carboxypeptidase regulatory-like domain
MRIQSVAAVLLGAIVSTGFADSSYDVSGVIVDSHTQSPVAHVRVWLLSTTQQEHPLEAITKEDGRFAFVVSDPGKYRIRISKPGYPPQFYLESDFALLSSFVVVGRGLDTSHLVFPAYREGVVSGQVVDEGADPVPGAIVALLQSLITDGERKVILREQMQADSAGEFRFANLRPGSYYVFAFGKPWFVDHVNVNEQALGILTRLRRKIDRDDVSSERQSNLHRAALRAAFYSGAQEISGASPIQVEAGGESGIRITLPAAEGVLVRARLNVPSGRDRAAMNLVKEIGGQDIVVAEGFRNSKEGVFDFRNVPPGSYQLVASSESGPGASGWRIRKKIEVGISDAEVTLSSPPSAVSPARRDLILGKAVEEIYGVVEESGAPRAGAFVLLMPRSLSDEVFRIDETGTDGSFRLTNIPVGDYYLIALNRGDGIAYRSADVAMVLEKSAMPIHVKTGNYGGIRLNLFQAEALSVPSKQ